MKIITAMRLVLTPLLKSMQGLQPGDRLYGKLYTGPLWTRDEGWSVTEHHRKAVIEAGLHYEIESSNVNFGGVLGSTITYVIVCIPRPKWEPTPKFSRFSRPSEDVHAKIKTGRYELYSWGSWGGIGGSLKVRVTDSLEEAKAHAAKPWTGGGSGGFGYSLEEVWHPSLIDGICIGEIPCILPGDNEPYQVVLRYSDYWSVDIIGNGSTKRIYNLSNLPVSDPVRLLADSDPMLREALIRS